MKCRVKKNKNIKIIFKCLKGNILNINMMMIIILMREFWLILPVMYARLKG